ncbi:MAG: NrdH-redoxin [Candidatus Altiarchaeales archaeon]|nr:MAG: NrdH-redoxin [Candidatus Altiarchaeales archaeon]RLI93970.1 MAG: NrdH-redoxin [Candidatus Altiarchaeales archaeon]RLI95566.1 MAG: NrdH-redoxin [Candidatus Altiarchaeales archaeon]HDO82599.1 glutaredoxin family protein [Candidatus Altiarchaeales archaeon]HEX55248.1 glutaredoxin family protein [Candidatus Altiarchaeales archaeon]
MGVIVYTTPTCPFCKMAMNYLRENGIDFVEKDVSIDREAAKEMIEKSGQMGVPVIDINGKIIVGFVPEEIEKAVRESKK